MKRKLFGRTQIVDQIVAGVLAPKPASFSLVGTKLVGKSALLDHLAAPDGPLLGGEAAGRRPPRFEDGNRIIVLKIDCDWAEAQQNLLAYLCQRLRHEVEEVNHIPLSARTGDEQVSHAHRIWQIARRLNQMGYRLVMLMDNFDRAFERQLIKMDSMDELRPLTLEAALVVVTEQPLHDLDRELAASPLFNVMEMIFVGLLTAQGANEWLDFYCADFPALEGMRGDLLRLAGNHPYLLRRIHDILPEVELVLTPEQPLGPEHSTLIRMRLAEHGRLLFALLWRKLQEPPPPIRPETVQTLAARLATAPLSDDQLARDQRSMLNWMINQAMVVYGPDGYRLFSPLFAEDLAERLGGQAHPATRSASPAPGVDDDDPIYGRLTKIEAGLLRYFRANSGALISAQDLLRHVWNRPDATPRRVQEGIRRLRLQLEDADPPVGVIENERGRGYRFVPAHPEL